MLNSDKMSLYSGYLGVRACIYVIYAGLRTGSATSMQNSGAIIRSLIQSPIPAFQTLRYNRSSLGNVLGSMYIQVRKLRECPSMIYKHYFPP